VYCIAAVAAAAAAAAVLVCPVDFAGRLLVSKPLVIASLL